MLRFSSALSLKPSHIFPATQTLQEQATCAFNPKRVSNPTSSSLQERHSETEQAARSSYSSSLFAASSSSSSSSNRGTATTTTHSSSFDQATFSDMSRLFPDPPQDYKNAVEALLNLQTPLAERKSPGQRPLDAMAYYISTLNLSPESLAIVHVAGTKGKGSTCAFTESLLRSHGYKTGLFTSPHLVEVRERIQIQGAPIAYADFVSCFWEIHRTLTAATPPEGIAPVPGYFRFLTLVALLAFSRHNVDVAIMEVGLGGRLDSTNIHPRPVVTGITHLGLDHVSILGNSLHQIGYEKAGIFKPNVPAFTSPQAPEAMAALKHRAQELESIGGSVSLSLAPSITQFAEASGYSAGNSLPMGLRGRAQAENAALALSLAKTFLDSAPPPGSGMHPTTSSSSSSSTTTLSSVPETVSFIEKISPLKPETDLSHIDTSNIPTAPAYPLTQQDLDGLSATYWPGRAQTIPVPEANCVFYLDGAHTEDSIGLSAEWFSSVLAGQVTPITGGSPLPAHAEHHPQSTSSDPGTDSRLLLFNCTADRKPAVLLGRLMKGSGITFGSAVFTPNLVPKIVPAAKIPTPSSNGTGASTSSSSPPTSSSHPESPAMKKSRTSSNTATATATSFPVPAEGTSPNAWQHHIGSEWKALTGAPYTVAPNVSEALDKIFAHGASHTSGPVQVLVTGSLLLVGDVIAVLEKKLERGLTKWQ